MISEQPGPPTAEDRERVGMEFLRVSQLRFLEGYRARMAEPHPMRKNARGETLNQREDRWSYAEAAEAKCPGETTKFLGSAGPTLAPWPAHERERWVAGFLHADTIAADRGTAAMERADPSRPPPRAKRAVVATQEDALLEMAPALTRREAKEFWNHHRGVGKIYGDVGEQK